MKALWIVGLLSAIGVAWSSRKARASELPAPSSTPVPGSSTVVPPTASVPPPVAVEPIPADQPTIPELALDPAQGAPVVTPTLGQAAAAVAAAAVAELEQLGAEIADEPPHLLAGRVASRYWEIAEGSAEGDEDRALVALFQNRTGGLAVDGLYGPKTAGAVAGFGIAPPPPLYWSHATSVAAQKEEWNNRIMAQAEQDEERAEEWLNSAV